jgi:hypothetical protein
VSKPATLQQWLSLHDAACRLPLRYQDAVSYLLDRGLVREVAGRRCVWGESLRDLGEPIGQAGRQAGRAADDDGLLAMPEPRRRA